MTMHQPEILEYRIFGRDGHVLFDVNNGTASIHLADGAVERLPELPSASRYPEGAPADNLVDGVVLTFVDITESQQLNNEHARLAAIGNSSAARSTMAANTSSLLAI